MSTRMLTIELLWVCVCSTAGMHVLRSTYLPAYTSLIRPPYSSDPFPLTSSPSAPYSCTTGTTGTRLASPVNSVQRETQVLDLFLSLKVREDVWADDTELHLERDESFKDLFDMMQPRSRVEDLVRTYGVRAGYVSVSSSGNCVVSSSIFNAPAANTGGLARATNGAGAPPPSLFPTLSARAAQKQKAKGTPKLPFNTLSVSFSPRSVSLIYSSKGTKRTIVQVSRSRDERLESSAKKLVEDLGRWVAEA